MISAHFATEKNTALSPCLVPTHEGQNRGEIAHGIDRQRPVMALKSCLSDRSHCAGNNARRQIGVKRMPLRDASTAEVDPKAKVGGERKPSEVASEPPQLGWPMIEGDPRWNRALAE